MYKQQHRFILGQLIALAAITVLTQEEATGIGNRICPLPFASVRACFLLLQQESSSMAIYLSIYSHIPYGGIHVIDSDEIVMSAIQFIMDQAFRNIVTPLSLLYDSIHLIGAQNFPFSEVAGFRFYGEGFSFFLLRNMFVVIRRAQLVTH